MSSPRPVRRRFPDYGWAWPTGELDRLLKAVLAPDESVALQAGLSWLAEHDINRASFREHRLLAALSDRFGKRLASSPAYPRLVGLQRMLWSRARMGLRDSREALVAFQAAGIAFMLIKGASRVALDPGAQRGRVSHDIDVVVRPPDMQRAFEILLDGGWQAASGAGLLRLKSEAASYRAMNFFKGEFGDIDLHQMAYPEPAGGESEDELWERSIAVRIDGVAACVPVAADRIALAIAHGALDAHTHSDWLVDVGNAICHGDVDWDGLLATLAARRILVPAASALTYLALEIGIPIPETALGALVRKADDQGLVRRMDLLECKPRTDFSLLSATARGIAKQLRLWRRRRAARSTPQTLWRARVARRARAAGVIAVQGSAEIKVSPGHAAILEIAVQIDMPPAPRRVDMELSTRFRHLAVLRYRKLTSYAGLRELRFRGPIELDEGEDRVFVKACPSRFSRTWQDQDEADRHRALPFAVTRVRVVS